ncbi:hypothetical protein DXG03_004646 [Asterophora parasitica]|uniref:Uncharacterized protein n=1 Tax=Asterophora parasitica TaxID=117018 RepID=A0A9P7K9Z8_9AGAR|nr:hypothetical protein DXG03_004646 [Asterophora parasitica]
MALPVLDKKEDISTPVNAQDEYPDEKTDELLVENRLPTDEERATLRIVSAPVPWAAYAIAIVEFGA